MIPVGTRVIVHWEYWDYVDNVELEYNGSDTFHGVVIEFDDNPHDRNYKKSGNIKIKIDEKGKFSDDTVYCGEEYLEIEGREMSESEIIVRNASQGWIRCTEENYPDSYNDIVIAYWYEDNKEWIFYSRHECPYGWNVLCRSEAYWRKIKEPIRNKEN